MSSIPASHRASFVLPDERAARSAVDVLTEVLFEGDAAVSAFERPDGRWDVTMHFAEAPDEVLVRELVSNAAGEEIARWITFDTVATETPARSATERMVARLLRVTAA